MDSLQLFTGLIQNAADAIRVFKDETATAGQKLGALGGLLGGIPGMGGAGQLLGAVGALWDALGGGGKSEPTKALETRSWIQNWPRHLEAGVELMPLGLLKQPHMVNHITVNTGLADASNVTRRLRQELEAA